MRIEEASKYPLHYEPPPVDKVFDRGETLYGKRVKSKIKKMKQKHSHAYSKRRSIFSLVTRYIIYLIFSCPKTTLDYVSHFLIKSPFS